jgi:hypothetical protein
MLPGIGRATLRKIATEPNFARATPNEWATRVPALERARNATGAWSKALEKAEEQVEWGRPCGRSNTVAPRCRVSTLIGRDEGRPLSHLCSRHTGAQPVPSRRHHRDAGADRTRSSHRAAHCAVLCRTRLEHCQRARLHHPQNPFLRTQRIGLGTSGNIPTSGTTGAITESPPAPYRPRTAPFTRQTARW